MTAGSIIIRVTRGPGITAALLLAATAAHAPDATLQGAAISERISVNDNTRPSGRLENGTLALHLEARDGLWFPDGPAGTAYPVAAFAEVGGPLQNPGPLIRVPLGTEVRVALRNSLAEPLTMFGLAPERGIASDSFRIEPGAVREMRFTASEAGTYYYAGRTDTSPRPLFARGGRDSQLNGVIVVDAPGAASPARDRIFVISWWLTQPGARTSATDPQTTLVINGLSWPHTERFRVAQGDSLLWRWISLTAAPHPMHLHGFYFRVDARGNGARDTIYTPEQRRLAVTETLRAGQTMAMAWSPERPGNWIFHCHLARHITPGAGVSEGPDADSPSRPADTRPHAARTHAMSRLVLGIHVEPRGEIARSAREPRPIRLLIRSQYTDGEAAARYAYVLGGSPEAADPAALPVPGPTLVLVKDEPVAITVVNRTHEPAAVHWHGIELESFPDGVPGWSGEGTNLLPAIAPDDSLTVRFTPPRAGTFMYHSHFNELQQISSGLYGAIIVMEPGRRYEPETDRLLIFSDDDPAGSRSPVLGRLTPALLNGSAEAEPILLRAGVTYRFRLANIRSNFIVAAALLDGDRPVQWRRVAKDGADLPPAQRGMVPSQVVFGPGEIYDFEFTPVAPGELTLRFGFPPAQRSPGIVVPPPRFARVHVR